MRTLLLFLFSIPALAQQTVTIPAQTVPLPPSTLPTGMTFDGTTLSVPALILTGGPSYGAGQYIVSLDTATPPNLTLVPYVASSTGSPCTAINGVLIPPTLTTIPAGLSTPSVYVKNAAVVATAHVYVTPTINATGASFPTNWEPFARIAYTGAINLYARFMPYGQPQTFTGGTVNLEVCP